MGANILAPGLPSPRLHRRLPGRLAVVGSRIQLQQRDCFRFSRNSSLPTRTFLSAYISQRTGAILESVAAAVKHAGHAGCAGMR